MKFLPKVNCRKSLKAFTLIELLVVIGILTVLLAIVLIAINPARQFSQANNTQRRSDVNAILNAVHQYGADNKGNLSALGSTTFIDTTVRTICGPLTGAAGACPNATSLDICADVVPIYLADLPLDPTGGSETPAGSTCTAVGATYVTGYTIVSTGAAAGNRVTVNAPAAELAERISVTR